MRFFVLYKVMKFSATVEEVSIALRRFDTSIQSRMLVFATSCQRDTALLKSYMDLVDIILIRLSVGVSSHDLRPLTSS